MTQPNVSLESKRPWSSRPSPEYFAISINLLRGYPWSARDGGGAIHRLKEATLVKFRNLEPFDQVGYSILVFRISNKLHNKE